MKLMIFMIIVIAGPTAVGKTKLSIELAKKYNAEIINYDSVQIYKDMNIVSAKVTEEEKEIKEEYIKEDGLHMSIEGHNTLASKVYEELEK